LTEEQLNSENDEGGILKSLASTWLPPMLWGVAAAMLIFAALVIRFDPKSFNFEGDEPVIVKVNETQQVSEEVSLALPDIQVEPVVLSVQRETNPRTILSSQPRTSTVEYVVESLDSVFEIAGKFNLEPDTIMWANYDALQDNPDMIAVGLSLKIPPVDGVLYEWKENDTLESVAEEFNAKVEDIVMYSGNHLDISNPVIEPGTTIMIPGGSREYVQWVMPTIARGNSGVSTGLQGACDTGDGGAYGTGTFIYPTYETRCSGNDYWGGHLAIDLACATGDIIVASDSGVVVYASWNGSGYGNMVMIDHGNGYQTLYAHLSSISVYCGQSVNQGNMIGSCGSTGNSTGSHLHFEVRYMGGFVSPWWVLP